MMTTVDLARIAVLVVDDIEDNLDVIEQMIEDEVWSVIRASSGEEAIRLAEKHRPDVVLLDLMMPRMNGLSVLRAFRGSEAFCEMAIIIQTAYADRDGVVAAGRLGCHHVLTKPLSRERLLAEIRQVLVTPTDRVSRAVDSPRAKTASTPSADIRRALDAAQGLLEVDDVIQNACDLTQKASQAEDTGRFRHLVSAKSPIGRKLIKIANSPAYPAEVAVRNVTEAIVRIGIRETKDLLRKAVVNPQDRERSSRTLKALELLETLALVFPDRTATNVGMLALLEDLKSAEARTALADYAAAPQSGTHPSR